MKKALIILTVLLLVAGFVSLIFNDVHVLQDLRHSNWNRQRFDDLVYDTQQKFMDGFMDDLMDNFDDDDEDDAHKPDASHKNGQAGCRNGSRHSSDEGSTEEPVRDNGV